MNQAASVGCRGSGGLGSEKCTDQYYAPAQHEVRVADGSAQQLASAVPRSLSAVTLRVALGSVCEPGSMGSSYSTSSIYCDGAGGMDRLCGGGAGSSSSSSISSGSSAGSAGNGGGGGGVGGGAVVVSVGRRLLPRGLAGLSRVVLSSVLLLLVTQQLLFLRTEDIQPMGGGSGGGFGGGIGYGLARHQVSSVSISPSEHPSGADVERRRGQPVDDGLQGLEGARQDLTLPSTSISTAHQLVQSSSQEVLPQNLAVAASTGGNGGPLSASGLMAVSAPEIVASAAAVQQLASAAKRLRDCVLTARAYLSVADEFKDDIMAERVGLEMERCLLILDHAVAGVGTGGSVAAVGASVLAGAASMPAGAGEGGRGGDVAAKAAASAPAGKGSEENGGLAAAVQGALRVEGKEGGKRQSGRLPEKLSTRGRSMLSKAEGMKRKKKKKKQSKDAPAVSRLKQKLEASERQTKTVILQSMLYSQMAAKSVPQGLHCLSLRLTTAWNSRAPMLPPLPDSGRGDSGAAAAAVAGDLQSQAERAAADMAARIRDPTLHHYALFSDNVLAVAVVVNSTATNLKDPSKHVFHVVADRLNFAAMRAWFAANPPRGGAMAYEVRCLDEYPWINSSFVPVLRQMETETMRDYYYRPVLGQAVGAPGSSVSARRVEAGGALGLSEKGGHKIKGGEAGGSSGSSGGGVGVGSGPFLAKEEYMELKYRNPKYLSILNHLRFYLPLIFPHLPKVLFLDDDVVVQRDLSPLWQVPMHGKVNLAVETCGRTFHRFKTYLNFSSPLLEGFDPEGCGWAFGMNLFDLDAWRAGRYTDKYHFWQEQNANRTLWKLGTLPAGLLTFYNATQALDRSWQVLGLGSKSTVPLQSIERAAVVHFNGHAKPWLDLAIPVYQPIWTRYVPYDDEFLRQCNIHPPIAADTVAAATAMAAVAAASTVGGRSAGFLLQDHPLPQASTSQQEQRQQQQQELVGDQLQQQ